MQLKIWSTFNKMYKKIVKFLSKRIEKNYLSPFDVDKPLNLPPPPPISPSPFDVDKTHPYHEFPAWDSIDESKKEEGGQAEEESISCKLDFSIVDSTDFDINISYIDNSKETAVNLANLLYIVNSGICKADCVKLLLKIGENTEDAEFVTYCVTAWNELEKDNQLVKPSEVFQVGR